MAAYRGASDYVLFAQCDPCRERRLAQVEVDRDNIDRAILHLEAALEDRPNAGLRAYMEQLIQYRDARK